jgi:HPt (histidine-containing phosphotransfer) domain-containing protein
MAPRNKDEASVSTFADHEVILPPHKLTKAVAKAGRDDPDLLAMAEKALAELSSEFGTWMRAECERLDNARDVVKTAGMDVKTRDELFRAAHDIKGEASTFGFPLIGPVADSLCRLIEHTPEINRIPMPLVDQHVDAIKAIIREYDSESCEEMARILIARLRGVTDDFLVNANRHRPEYLDGVVAPSLVPDGSAG